MLVSCVLSQMETWLCRLAWNPWVTSHCSYGKNRILPCWLQSPAWSSSYHFGAPLPPCTLATLPFRPFTFWWLLLPHSLCTDSSLCLKLVYLIKQIFPALLSRSDVPLQTVRVEGVCYPTRTSLCSPGWLKSAIIPHLPHLCLLSSGITGKWYLFDKVIWVLWLIPTIISSMIAEILSGCPSFSHDACYIEDA